MDMQAQLQQTIQAAGGQKRFAQRAGLSESQVSHLVNSYRGCSREIAVKIARAFPELDARDLVWLGHEHRLESLARFLDGEFELP